MIIDDSHIVDCGRYRYVPCVIVITLYVKYMYSVIVYSLSSTISAYVHNILYNTYIKIKNNCFPN